jgi:hypothetical protein
MQRPSTFVLGLKLKEQIGPHDVLLFKPFIKGSILFCIFTTLLFSLSPPHKIKPQLTKD